PHHAVAARRLERVQVGEGGPGALLQSGAQHGLGAGEALLDVVGTQVEDVGHLRRGQLLDLAQDEDRAVAVEQPVDELLEEILDRGAGEAVLGSGVGAVHGGLVLEHLWGRSRPAAVSTEPLERLVDADAQQPRGEASAARELPEPGEGQDVGLLHQLLDLALFRDEGADGALGALVAPPPHQPEGLDVPAQDPGDEVTLGGAGLLDRWRKRQRGHGARIRCTPGPPVTIPPTAWAVQLVTPGGLWNLSGGGPYPALDRREAAMTIALVLFALAAVVGVYMAVL